MSWEASHRESDELAWRAYDLEGQGDHAEARRHFLRAAQAEEAALSDVDPQSEPRTFSITALNACAYWYRAGEFEHARRVAAQALQVSSLDGYAASKIHSLLEAMEHSQRLQNVRAETPESWRTPERDAVWRRRPTTAIVAAFAAASIVIASAAYLYFTLGVESTPYTTAVGEEREVTFSDGSRAHLNTGTVVRWVEGENDRRVELVRGEALFNVVSDERRPFRVRIRESVIEVVGTRFNVYERASGAVVVSVLEGKVDVSGPDREWRKTLRANEELEYEGKTILAERHSIGRSVPWWEGEIEFVDTPLDQAVEKLARYTKDRIVIGDPRVARLRINTTARTDDILTSIKRLEEGGKFRVVERNGEIRIEGRADTGN